MKSAVAPAPPIAADVLIEAGEWPAAGELRRLVDLAVAAARAASGADVAEGSELSVVFTDDVHTAALNRRHRRIDAPTNVLSFPAPATAPGRFGPMLGDIVLASETIGREAAADGLALTDHLTHLIIHGFLHLLGYDHTEEEAARVMEELETSILARLGIADPHDPG